MGEGQRPSAELTRYRLGDAEATRRARAATAARAVSTTAPLLFTVVLLRRLDWAPGALFWAVAAVLLLLVVVRAVVGYGRSRRRLRSLVVTVSDEDVHVELPGDAYSIPRARVARIVEIEGALGGLRVESRPDLQTGSVDVAVIPRGGASYADVRSRLAPWTAFERRGRRGPAVRLAVGVLVVAGIFFVPFLLDDFVARSKLVAAALVGGMWIALRVALRGR